MVKEIASKYQLDPDFVASVIKAESNFNPHAVSRKGARGLMQLMPQTASQLGVKDAFDPKANVEAGTAHLNALLEQYHDDPVKALAAYNAGAHRVKQYHGVPPYRETRAYVAAIVRDFNAKKRAELRAEAARKKASSPATTQQNAKSTPKRTQAQQQASISNPQSAP
jgi:soluble lytic murein transglycosylase-like protein